MWQPVHSAKPSAFLRSGITCFFCAKGRSFIGLVKSIPSFFASATIVLAWSGLLVPMPTAGTTPAAAVPDAAGAPLAAGDGSGPRQGSPLRQGAALAPGWAVPPAGVAGGG